MSPTVFSTFSLLAVNTMPLASAARAYAEQGIPVFPLVPRAKEPRVSRGCYSATTDLDQIQHWWSRWPNANIGIATGKASACWVLDIDPRHGGLGSLDILERHARDWGATMPLSRTLRQLTGGGGIHLFYQMPTHPGVDPPPTGRLPAIRVLISKRAAAMSWLRRRSIRVEWRINGKTRICLHCFLSRSLICGSKRVNAPFRGRRFPPPAHQRARQAHAMPQDRERDPEYWLHAALRHAIPGNRHNYACFLAIQLVSVVGCSAEEAEYWMREYVAQVIQLPADPYDLDDALRCLRYAWEHYGP